jgi:ribonuclease VapC
MFVDASAMVAILTCEPEAGMLSDILALAPRPITSPLAIFEAALAIRRKWRSTVAEAEDDVRSFIETAAVRVVPVTDADAATALEAFARYGKGQGHPAQLNMGDCFAYAVARNHRAAMLFKGGDFAKTDIERARPLME